MQTRLVKRKNARKKDGSMYLLGIKLNLREAPFFRLVIISAGVWGGQVRKQTWQELQKHYFIVKGS